MVFQTTDGFFAMRAPQSLFLVLILFLLASILSLIVSHFSLPGAKHELEHYKAAALSRFSEATACEVQIPATCEASELVRYWSGSTDCYESPLRDVNGLHAAPRDRKYVVMEPDLGGWNNIRMSLEVAIAFVLVTGRILVLPPHQILYLLATKTRNGRTGVEDYVDLSRIQLAKGVEIMPMSEFLRDVAATGMLANKPFQLGEKESFETVRGRKLWDYLADACWSRPWQPGKTFLTLNTSVMEETFIDPVRLEDMAIPEQNRKLRWYDADMASQRAVYFSGNPKNRLLTLFYAYLFFPTAKEERLVKRFVRDRVRYKDKIYCVGGRIVEQMALLADPSVTLPYRSMQRTKYVAFHIRRGDFQHKWVKIPAEEILALTLCLVPDRARRVAYIATDEQNSSFFDPFRAAFKQVYFLQDFTRGAYASIGLGDMQRNELGMVEQVVCASSDVFIGTPLSTFTGYITRMRGYMNATVPGMYDRTFYYMQKHRNQLQDSPHIHVPFWPREFVEAFEGIDERET